MNPKNEHIVSSPFNSAGGSCGAEWKGLTYTGPGIWDKDFLLFFCIIGKKKLHS